MTATDTPAVRTFPEDSAIPARPNHADPRANPPSPDTPPPWPWWTLIVRALVVALLLAAGVAVFAALRATAPTLDNADAQRTHTRVLTYTPVPVAVQRPFRGYGSARPLRAADVPARVTAVVTAVPDHILDGAPVQQGDTLVELDRADFATELDRLDAALDELDASLAQLDTQEARLAERLALEEQDLQITNAELARVQRLADRNVANEQDLDRARSAQLATRRALTLTRETLDAMPPRRASVAAQRAGLQAQRRLAEQNLQRTVIVAPLTGVLQTVDVEPGEAVAPGQRVARIVDPAVLEVPIQLPAASQAMVRVGDTAVLRPTHDLTRAYDATIARVAPEVDPLSRSLTVFALLDQTGADPAQRLAPGTYVQADVLTGPSTPSLVIPRRAIRKQRVQAIVPNDQGVPAIVSLPIEPRFPLRLTLPQTGLTDDQWAVLPDDALPPGTAILATGSSTLLDGQPVTPIAILTPAVADPSAAAAATATATE